MEQARSAENRRTPRERFWDLWGRVVGVLVLPALALALYSTRGPLHSFWDRLFSSVVYGAGALAAGLILTFLAWPLAESLSDEEDDARADTQGEVALKEGLATLTGALTHEAGDAAVAANAAAVPAESNDSGAEESDRA